MLAHKYVDAKGKVLEQTLEDHLFATGEYSSELGKAVGLESFMKLIGYIHDCGKADRTFQDYINGKIKRHVNHSSAGGRVLDDFIQYDPELTNLQKKDVKFAYFQEILTYIILGHHGLFDLISFDSTEYKISKRLQYDENGDYHYAEDVLPFVKSLDLKHQEQKEKTIVELIKDAYQEFVLVYSKLKEMAMKNPDKKKRKTEKEYYVSCLTRLCLAFLKEADIYDSTNAFHNVKQHLWNEYERNKIWEDASAKIESMYQKYESTPILTELNKTRNDLAIKVREASIKNDNGIYKLELPTGAGKTKASLRYAVGNAKRYNRNHIFYITAYLSVLEQNAADIRSILDMDDAILEHHSNFVEENDNISDDDYDQQTQLRESWESPIILTTMVQFVNTLFKEKASNIRRFSKLTNSVVIIDEVQSLPLKVLSNFNLMMNFMKEIMNCNIVHCTATQPILDNKALTHPLHYGNEKNLQADIVNLDMNIFKSFKRVDYYNLTGLNAGQVLSTEALSAYIQEELQVFDSCLVVLNTKSAVSKLYNYLEEMSSDVEIIYLTTNLCAAHRLDVITEMNKKLKQNRNSHVHHKIICISTQLIEAGVDVDFDIVFRSLAGIDSLIQCAGRCNREGKLTIDTEKVNGKVYIMRYQEENLSNLPDIKASVDASEYAIRSFYKEQKGTNNEIDIEKLHLPYSNKYYISNQNKLDYIDSKNGSTMVDELGRNEAGRFNYAMSKEKDKEKKPKMYQAFRTAAQNFELIDKGTTGVIVPYKNQELINRLKLAMSEKNFSDVKSLLKKLQRYSINVYLCPKLEPFIYKLNNGYNVYFLQEMYYNGNKGIVTDALADLII